MALAKPVIGTMGASFDEFIIDGKNGFLVPPNNVNALKQKIIDAWRHPQLTDIGKEAKKAVASLAPRYTVSALLDFYGSILKQN